MTTPATTRTCGSCTFCCKVMAVKELKKASGAWCVHCKPGKGCEVYGEHPASCQDFLCQWLVQTQAPEELRPDRCKVVLTVDGTPQQPRLVANCDTSNPMAWRQGAIYELLKRRARETWGTGATVIAKAGLRVWVLGPNDDRDLGEVPENTPWQIVPGPDQSFTVRLLPPIPEVQMASARAELERLQSRPVPPPEPPEASKTSPV